MLYCDEQVDGFPGDIVFFMRVLDLLRGQWLTITGSRFMLGGT